MRMRDLAASVILSRSGLTRLADRLEREGLIRRESCSRRRARRLRGPHPGRRRACSPPPAPPTSPASARSSCSTSPTTSSTSSATPGTASCPARPLRPGRLRLTRGPLAGLRAPRAGRRGTAAWLRASHPPTPATQMRASLASRRVTSTRMRPASRTARRADLGSGVQPAAQNASAGRARENGGETEYGPHRHERATLIARHGPGRQPERVTTRPLKGEISSTHDLTTRKTLRFHHSHT